MRNLTIEDRALKGAVAWLCSLLASCGETISTYRKTTDGADGGRAQAVLERHCVECHGADRQESDLDLRSVAAMLSGGQSGPAIVPGRPDESLVLDMIVDELMPPEGDLLSAEEVVAVRQWIASGALESH